MHQHPHEAQPCYIRLRRCGEVLLPSLTHNLEDAALKCINDKNGTPPHGPYSHSVQSGNMLYISGQIPYDTKDNLIGSDIATQTEQTMKNLASLLDSAGLSLDNIVKTTVYLLNWDDFAAFNTVYARFMGNHKPARATVQVGGLVAGCLIEVEAIAEFNGQ